MSLSPRTEARFERATVVVASVIEWLERARLVIGRVTKRMKMSHIVDGQFKSDKYEWSKPGFVPLKLTDPMAQPVLWQYAQTRRAVDPEFSGDLETALCAAGYAPPTYVCFACQSTVVGETRPALVPTPICVRCGQPCVQGCWVVQP